VTSSQEIEIVLSSTRRTLMLSLNAAATTECARPGTRTVIVSKIGASPTSTPLSRSPPARMRPTAGSATRSR